MPILEMETTLDISRQLNDTNPPAQIVTTCGVGIGEMGERSKVTTTEGHATGSGRVDENRARKRPAAGQPARTSETARVFALASTHAALTLHLFVSFEIHSKLGSGTYGYIYISFIGADSSVLPLEFDIDARFWFCEHDY